MANTVNISLKSEINYYLPEINRIITKENKNRCPITC